MSNDVDYTWDAEGELASVDDENYVYDAAGSRLVRSDASGTTVYLPGGQEILIAGSTVSVSRYYSFGGATVATRSGSGLGAVTSLVSDRHGSTVAAVPNTEWTATSVARVFSDPFGATRGSSDSGLPGDHRFLGGVRDGGSGLTLLGARYYDEVVGQFISVDPLLDASMPGHFNAYAYSFNNPMTFSDPSGLKAASEGGGSSKSGSGGTPAPPSTSWQALGECKDFFCGASWFGGFGQQVLIGGAEAVGQLLWMTCTLCMGIESGVTTVEALSDWDGYVAQQEAQAAATAAIWEGGLPAIWGSIADPIIHNWENNPGNAFGHLYVDVATLAIPGAGVGVGLKGLRTLKVTEQAAVETADAA